MTDRSLVDVRRMTLYPYDLMFYDEKTLLKKLFKPGKPIRHQETCPVCGRTMVNIYRRDGVWMCKKCWDKDDLK